MSMQRLGAYQLRQVTEYLVSYWPRDESYQRD